MNDPARQSRLPGSHPAAGPDPGRPGRADLTGGAGAWGTRAGSGYTGLLFALLLLLLTAQFLVSRETDRLVAAQMSATGQFIARLTEERAATLSLLARLAGQEPRLGAVMTTDPVTVADLLTHDLNPSLAADFMAVTDRRGRVSADTRGRLRPGADLSAEPGVRAALAGREWHGMLVLPGEIDLVATAPIHVGGQDLGTVTLGRRLGDDAAALFYPSTGSRVTLLAGGQIVASDWPAAERPALLCALHEALPENAPPDGSPIRFVMPFAGHRRLCLLAPLPGQGAASGQLLIQSNLDASLRPYTNIRHALLASGLIGLLMAVLGSLPAVRAAVRRVGASGSGVRPG